MTESPPVTSHYSDVLVTLLRLGLLPNTPDMILRLKGLFGVTKEDLEEAKSRRWDQEWASLPVTEPKVRNGFEKKIGSSVSDPKPRLKASSGVQVSKSNARELSGVTSRSRTKVVPRPKDLNPQVAPTLPRRSRVKGGVTELWCTANKGQLGKPHFAPEEEFAPRSDSPWRRVTLCDDHRSAYHRTRHVTVAVMDSLNKIGVSILLDDDSKIVGLKCSVCGKPFVAGELVGGDTEVHHLDCA